MVNQQLELVVRLTEKFLSPREREQALFDFAESTGWRPSDTLLEGQDTERISNGHLIAEHGLDRSAVITFLPSPITFGELTYHQTKSILGISYNNLIDWHLFPDRHGLTVVFNRDKNFRSEFFRKSEHKDLWRVESFDKITGKKTNANVKALDDAIVETVSHWRRVLSGTLGLDIPNYAYSALFNGIILMRAVEDHTRARRHGEGKILRGVVENAKDAPCSEFFRIAMRELKLDARTKLVRDVLKELEYFDKVDGQTWVELVNDFYSSKYAPYNYDFSLISKQALSRVYEKYVSVLRLEQTDQLTLFVPLPIESKENPFGEVYTPQYIARFFAKFLKDEVAPRDFRSARIMDPACGSGVFLRTVLEMQCDPRDSFDLKQDTANAFKGITGVDVDLNACFATRLSLSLLHLVLTDTLPSDLDIAHAESIDYFQSKLDSEDNFDAIIANPPFVRWESLTPLMRDRVIKMLDGRAKGKVDLYIAFLALAIQRVRPGGFFMFVLPHSFLFTDNTRFMRDEIAEHFDVRVLADLSEISVFDGVGAYVVLLVCQRRSSDSRLPEPSAICARIRDFVGHGLQAILQRSEESNPAYEIYEVPQSEFKQDSWIVLPKRQRNLHVRLAGFPSLGDVCEVQQGVVTGADKFFLRSKRDIPKGETGVWRPLIKDRAITKYGLPKNSDFAVFYPIAKGERISEEELSDRYPATWHYLLQNKDYLQQRSAVRKGNCEWWSPERLRKPNDVYGRPKILTPHLTISPRFGFDAKGQFAVSRSPMIFAHERTADPQFLRFVLAILNSSIGFWQVINSSTKYGKGYVQLEKKQLLNVHLPHPAHIRRDLVKNIDALVIQRFDCVNISQAKEIEFALDDFIAEAYGLSHEDRMELGVL